MQKISIILFTFLVFCFSSTLLADYGDEYIEAPYNDFAPYEDEPPPEYVESDYFDAQPLPDDEIEYNRNRKRSVLKSESSYFNRLPNQIDPPGERLIVIDPNVHTWGAYLPDGKLIKAGLATSGGKWCRDTGRPCRTKAGSFRIFSLGDSDCISSLYPIGEGGAPMPYCMFFNGNQGLHGSNQVTEGNISHGCVRVSVRDAAWLRYEFANKGTRIDVKPY